MKATVTFGFMAAALAAGCGSNPDDTSSATGMAKIAHVVVIYMENHSFDNLYGQYPGAEGIANAMMKKGAAGDTVTQIDSSTGQAFITLPAPFDNTNKAPDARFPTNLPNQPFDITQFVPPGMLIPDLVHRYYQEQIEMDNGAMDLYASVEDAKGLTMGYYPTAQLPMYKYAQEGVLCDHFFHSAFGGSFMNHIYFISAGVATFPNAPSSIVAVLNPTAASSRTAP